MSGLWLPPGVPAAPPPIGPPVDVSRAARRAMRLRRRAQLKALGSNGRRKDEREAEELVQRVIFEAQRQGVSEERFERWLEDRCGASSGR